MAKEENVDEAITAEAKDINEMKVDLKNEQNTKSYEETMEINIFNINVHCLFI